MSHSMKAILLSALVFPGAGHLYLKRYWRAGLLIMITLGSMATVIREALQQALPILEKIQTEGGKIDIHRISELSHQAASQYQNPLLSLSLSLIIICWIIGILDAYRLAKQLPG